LSVPEGHVTVSWWQEPAQEARGQLVLQWREQGGPAVKPPKRFVSADICSKGAVVSEGIVICPPFEFF